MAGRSIYKILLLACMGLSYGMQTLANTPIIQPNLSASTKIAPAYFGPNAFQVPDMLDGRTTTHMSINVAADYYSGTLTHRGGDVTSGISCKCIIPLFSPKVNFVAWMPIAEYYYVNEEVNAIRRIPHKGSLSGWDSGDVYFSTDIQLFVQQLHGADMVVRAALKSASANTYAKARYYDAPGYFFDAAIGRNFSLNDKSKVRIAMSSGFLCWQTDVGRQNDAVMYGLQAAWQHEKLQVKATWGGYMGWEGDGDRPMIAKVLLSYTLKALSIDAYYKIGINDWPFRQMSLATTYTF